MESVSLERADLVSVPLTFLAETPGEMTVSDLRVAYDLPEPPSQPRLPAPAVARVQAAADVSQLLTLGALGVAAEVGVRRSPLAGAPIEMVAGVGEHFSSVLQSLEPPVTTITELAELDPETEIEGIPHARRLELKTKAEMTMALDFEVAPFAALADESLETLLRLPPDELAQRAGQPKGRAERLQRQLRALRLLIKNDAFRSLRVADLLRGDV